MLSAGGQHNNIPKVNTSSYFSCYVYLFSDETGECDVLSQTSHVSKPESITILSDDNEQNTSNVQEPRTDPLGIRKNVLRRTKKLIQRCCDLNLEFGSSFVGISSVLADNPDSVSLEDIDSLRIECLQKLGDANVSSDSSENEDTSPPIQHRSKKMKSRYLVTTKTQERRRSLYDPSNPYTLQSQMKHPFIGHPYAHKPGPHYHIHTSPPPAAMMYGEHTIPQHQGGFAKYSDQPAVYAPGPYPVYGSQQQQQSFASVSRSSTYSESRIPHGQHSAQLEHHDTSNVHLSSAPSTPRPSSISSEHEMVFTSTPKESDLNIQNQESSTPVKEVNK